MNLPPPSRPVSPGQRIVACIQSGLPEHEGSTFTVLWGVGYGATLHEVIADIVKDNPAKAIDLQLLPNDTATDWGFPLRFLN